MKESIQDNSNKDQIPIPPEIKGKGLNFPEKDSSPNPNDVVPSDQTPDKQSLDSYTKHVHSYIRENIILADKKATFVFAICAALLAFLYKENAVVPWKTCFFDWRFTDFVLFVSFIGLTLSCFFSIGVVFPRLQGSKIGFVFWESIAKFSTSDDFNNSVQHLSDKELTIELLKHSFELSKVCNRKYKWVNYSLIAGAIGAGATILFFLIG